MSIRSKELTETFLAPLRGSSTILVLHDVEARLPIGRLIMGCASLQPSETLILDVDVFYSSNMDRLVEDVDPVGRARVVLLSEKAFDLKALIVLLSSKTRFVMIDGLNSLFSLAGDRRAAHQLAILMKMLSYNARINGSWVVATAYSPVLGRQRRTNQRSLLALGDLVVETQSQGGSLRLKAGFESGWPDDQLEV